MRKVINEHTTDLEAVGLSVYCGWSPEIAAQVVTLSQEDEIRRYTPKDATSRFVTVETADAWYYHPTKRHIVYVLLDEAGMVGGLFWFSHKPSGEPSIKAEYSIGIRMYQSQRGKGLAGAFFEAAHVDFSAQNAYSGGFWLITDMDNERARQFYAKHGYEAVSTDGDRELLVRK